ncbi:MAG: hypothetical protein VX641_04010 [Planctomycetota bacterium]|nr:hypothetical protein [Planctomycetota bacterium]
MMFLVIFGSLSVAMAIMAQGNLRAADSALQVSRASSAAQTGLVFGGRRLSAEAKRWIVRKGVIDREYGYDLWAGEINPDGEDVTLLPPEGYTTTNDPDGLMDAILDAHLADDHSFDAVPGDSQLPGIVGFGILETKPIRINEDDSRLYFRLRYEIVESDQSETRIRITSIGEDQGITRQVAMDFRVTKKIPFAVVSPNRIMIGKNVLVEGPLGTRFGTDTGELNEGNGDPLIMRSDFRYLDEELDARLDDLDLAVAQYDVDGDGRIRPNHPIEGQALGGGSGMEDLDGDQYVTEFDLFLNTFDDDGDGRVVWDRRRADEAGIGEVSLEFEDIDNQLARLIDRSFPDRNLDGTVDDMDVQLGYDDGVLDTYDMYAKVRGNLAFGVSENEWNTANGGSWRGVVKGPVVADTDLPPVEFEVPEDRLRDVTTDMFADNQDWYRGQAGSDSDLASQASENMESNPESEYVPSESAEWESIPVGSPNPYDWIQRSLYRNMTFENLLIPIGSNARFENCTFVGTTYVETTTHCSHPNWNYLGALDRIEGEDGNITFAQKFSGLDGAPSPDGSSQILDTKDWSNNIVFDGCTFVGAIAGDRPGEYTHWRNKMQFTGPTRFYLDPHDSDLQAQEDSAEILQYIDNFTDEQNDYFSRSMMMMPGWSVDVGNFSNEQAEEWESTPVVNLRGVIIAGVLDARGTVDVFGTLLMTFRPTEGAGPLFYGGSSDQFNTTLGYFGPEDGDLEGSDPASTSFEGFGEIMLRYNPDSRLPDGIPWPIAITALPDSYSEGGY